MVSAISHAQETIVETVIRVRQLVTEVKTNEALALMDQIEPQCLPCIIHSRNNMHYFSVRLA